MNAITLPVAETTNFVDSIDYMVHAYISTFTRAHHDKDADIDEEAAHQVDKCLEEISKHPCHTMRDAAIMCEVLRVLIVENADGTYNPSMARFYDNVSSAHLSDGPAFEIIKTLISFFQSLPGCSPEETGFQLRGWAEETLIRQFEFDRLEKPASSPEPISIESAVLRIVENRASVACTANN